LAKGLLDKPVNRVCFYCSTIFIQTSTKGSNFCNYVCKHNYKMAEDLGYKIKRLLNGSKSRSKIKSLPFNLTLQYLINLYEEQEGLCAITNVPFCFKTHGTKNVANKNTISLDRVEPELDYTKGNVRFVTFQVNCAKGFYTDEDFFEMCSNAIRNRL